MDISNTRITIVNLSFKMSEITSFLTIENVRFIEL